MATVKKAISLRADVYRDGANKADKFFGGNFSAYVCYLISKDKEELCEDSIKQNRRRDEKIIATIDEIMDL